MRIHSPVSSPMIPPLYPQFLSLSLTTILTQKILESFMETLNLGVHYDENEQESTPLYDPQCPLIHHLQQPIKTLLDSISLTQLDSESIRFPLIALPGFPTLLDAVPDFSFRQEVLEAFTTLLSEAPYYPTNSHTLSFLLTAEYEDGSWSFVLEKEMEGTFETKVFPCDVFNLEDLEDEINLD